MHVQSCFANPNLNFFLLTVLIAVAVVDYLIDSLTELLCLTMNFVCDKFVEKQDLAKVVGKGMPAKVGGYIVKIWVKF